MSELGVKFLFEIGCCRRCVLIFLGERTVDKYSHENIINRSIKKIVTQHDLEDDKIKNGASEENGDEEDEEEEILSCIADHNAKKQKVNTCITCLGLLQWGCSNETVQKMVDVIQLGNYDAVDMSVVVSLPVSITFRVHCVWAHLLKQCPNFPAVQRVESLTIMKDVWKNLVGPQVSVNTSKKFLTGQNIDFALDVKLQYKDDTKDCSILDTLCGPTFTDRRKMHRKYTDVYTRSSVDYALKKLSDEDILGGCPEPPPTPENPLSFDNMTCQHISFYMAGGLRKVLRSLCLTPYFISKNIKGRKMAENDKNLALTVHFCKTLDDIKFSSSGREDVDVRCLGNGRPFVIEFLNPRKIYFSKQEVADLQKKVNSSSDIVAIRDLQVISKVDTKNLKEGEEEKTKSYSALCFIREGYSESQIETLNKQDEIVLQQKTPLRVLHRRPLAIRPRTVFKMSAQPINNFFFKINVTTQAGTYIKEFVHGDLGRTVPNVGSIIGCEVDIIALDVEKVELDWPTRIED
ncbi:unnamed protein product, partial [Meganyctiphanes norvegica]